jgi:hypothetical protein
LKKHNEVLAEALAPPPLKNSPIAATTILKLDETRILPTTHTVIDISKENFLP